MGFTNLQIKLTVNKDQEVQKYLFKNTNKKKDKVLHQEYLKGYKELAIVPNLGCPHS